MRPKTPTQRALFFALCLRYRDWWFKLFALVVQRARAKMITAT